MDIADCLLSAMRTEAREQSVPFEQFVQSLEFALAGGDVNLSDVLDWQPLEDEAVPCMLNATQEAGIA